MEKEKKLFVYVAGPLSGDMEKNTDIAIRDGMRLRDAGFVPIIPHLFVRAHAIDPREYEYWMSWDFDLLERCDLVYRIPGKSNGADREVARAKSLHIPVWKDINTLIGWKIRRGRWLQDV